MLIHRPKLSNWDFFAFRVQGPGFGNLLFPVYRAFEGQKKLGGELIFPQFRQLKIGPYLRGEKDKRTYGNIFLARSKHDLYLQTCALFKNKVNETSTSNSVRGASVIEYIGLGNYFKDFDKRNTDEFIEYLLNRTISKSKIQEKRSEISSNHVAIHLRLGDFANIPKGDPAEAKMNSRTEISWYEKNINILKRENPNVKFTLFTDEARLPPETINKLGNPTIDRSDNALEAILQMAQHKTIIGSKSSFSLWGAYLGKSKLRIPENFEIERYATAREIDYVAT